MFRAGMWGLAALVTALVLSGCANKGRLAPFDDHSIGAARSSNRVLPGAENAGKPGYYTVKPGDTLIRIGMDNGQSGRDIARWNKLDNPNLIEAGQVLRVVPPAPEAPLVRPPATAGTASAPATVSSAPASPVAPAVPTAAEDAISFQWPARGNLISGFDESKNKGLDIGGKAGDPVLAAADGRVVYAGAGLRGYGNLVLPAHEPGAGGEAEHQTARDLHRDGSLIRSILEPIELWFKPCGIGRTLSTLLIRLIRVSHQGTAS